MTVMGWLQIGFFAAMVLAITKPLGIYLFRVFEGERQPLPRTFGRVERALSFLTGVDPKKEQTWKQYAGSVLAFSVCGLLVTYLIQRLQGSLPLNPQKFAGVEPNLAFNTASSFTTNTNWQAYPGEGTMSYLSQMAGLAWHNFTSAAVGIGVALVLARGFTRQPGPDGAKTVGNFWVDLNRCLVYVLLPAGLVLTLFFVSQGVIQNFAAYKHVTTLEGADQIIAMGPVASQEVIKELGTNGGGFMNANSAHPFENPTPLTNFVEMLLIFAIPAALTYTFGRMARNQKQGWAIFGAMSILFAMGVAVAYHAETRPNAAITGAGPALFAGSINKGEGKSGSTIATEAGPIWLTVTGDHDVELYVKNGSTVSASDHDCESVGDSTTGQCKLEVKAGDTITWLVTGKADTSKIALGAGLPSGVDQHAGNLEGKEVRFGVANSALFAVVTTNTSCGAVNSWHDSFNPIGGMVPLVNIQLGEVVFGGVGSGLYGMLIFALLSVFIAGLMVGRTPEYLGKKIEAKEMKLAMLYILVFPLLILGLSAWAAVAHYAAIAPDGSPVLTNSGPHGLSEILYAFTSGAGNNGSAFGGLNANTPFWNLTLAFDMLIGRFLMMIPVLAIAGSMIGKKVVAPGPGTFPTDGRLFTILLVAVILILGALTFFPALCLGPVVEQFSAIHGQVF